MILEHLGLIIGAVLVLVVLLSSIKVVEQSNALLIERLGKFHRELRGGFHIILPFFDSIRQRVDLRTQVLDIPAQSVITKDNAGVIIDAVVYFRITDAFNAVYEIQNLRTALANITATTLRNAIGLMELDQTFSSRDTINVQLRASLDEATDKWGVKVERVEVKNIEPPQELKRAMEKQMQAERTRREQLLLAEADQKSEILRAEGDKQSQILRAEADKEAQILRAEAEREAQIRRAEGEAQAIRTVAEARKEEAILVYTGLKDAGLDDVILSYEKIQAFKALAASDNKTFIPTEVGSLMGSVGAVQDLLQSKPAQ